MSFAHPLALLLLLLLVPVGLLYWLRLRVPRVVVGTGLFWQKALAEEPLRARWQRWRTPVSLMLHVLTVVLLAAGRGRTCRFRLRNGSCSYWTTRPRCARPTCHLRDSMRRRTRRAADD